MAGTLVGSDLFNVLGVLGLAAFFCPYPLHVSSGAIGSIQAMIGMIFVLILFMRTGWRLTRVEGACLILIALLRWRHDLFTSP